MTKSHLVAKLKLKSLSSSSSSSSSSSTSPSPSPSPSSSSSSSVYCSSFNSPSIPSMESVEAVQNRGNFRSLVLFDMLRYVLSSVLNDINKTSNCQWEFFQLRFLSSFNNNKTNMEIRKQRIYLTVHNDFQMNWPLNF